MSFVLQKDRSPSDVLVDTVQFVKHHYELMLRPVIYLIAPVGILAILNQILTYQAVTNPSGTGSGGDASILLFSLILGLLTIVMIFCSSLIGFGAVRQVYENQKDRSSTDYAGYFIRKNFLAFFGLALLYLLAYFAGLMFLVIPGIYLFFALYPSFGALVHERKGVMESFKRGNSLTKGNWWFVVGATLLFSVLLIGIDFITDLPSIILGYMMGIESGPDAFLAREGFSAVYLFLALFNTIGFIVIFLFYALVGVHISIIYFTLRERKDGDRITDEIAGFESDLSDEQANDGFGNDDGLSFDSDDDPNNPEGR